MNHAQLAKLIRAHMAMHEQISLSQLSEDVNAETFEVAAMLRQMPQYQLGEITQTVTHRRPTGPKG